MATRQLAAVALMLSLCGCTVVRVGPGAVLNYKPAQVLSGDSPTAGDALTEDSGADIHFAPRVTPL